MEENKNVAYLLCHDIKCCILLQKRKTARGSLTTCLVQTSEMRQAGKHSLRIIWENNYSLTLAERWSVLSLGHPASFLLSLERQAAKCPLSTTAACKPRLAFILGTCQCPPCRQSWAGLSGSRGNRISKDLNTHLAGIQGHGDKCLPQNSESPAFAMGPSRAQS